MLRPTRIRPEGRTIFGDTYEGVANPIVAVERGWPTRLHGPNFTYVQQSYRYRRRPFQKAPFLGLGADAGANCSTDAECAQGTVCCGINELAWCTPHAQCDAAIAYGQHVCRAAGGELTADGGCSVPVPAEALPWLVPPTEPTEPTGPIDEQTSSSVIPEQSAEPSSSTVRVPLAAAVAVGALAIILMLTR